MLLILASAIAIKPRTDNTGGVDNGLDFDSAVLFDRLLDHHRQFGSMPLARLICREPGVVPSRQRQNLIARSPGLPIHAVLTPELPQRARHRLFDGPARQ